MISTHFDAARIASQQTAAPPAALAAPASSAPEETSELQEAFQDFVGQTFYGQLIKSMRQTVDKPAYFHGGRAEEVFQSQMDQMLAERMSDATAETFAQPMFELFSLRQA